ncbi:MAG: hypothetical protein HN820_02130 [Candidatus Marinimicrobia bacterium]|nr:hypothetical protein [Candidatus Neomarinimicrobiota bacterium]
MKKLLFFCICSILIADTDHLVFSRITIKPDNGELISIKNPTSVSISLNNYYISDSPNYYKIQSENDLSPGHSISDFLVKFPESASISAGDSILISIQSNYQSYYGDDFVVDFTLRDDLIETESGSAGLSSIGRLDDAQECLILFYWDGNESSPVKDVDYFLWGGSSQAVNKTSVLGYSSDTEIASQIYLPPHETNYTFSRQSFNEEESANGNGITGHDETSENLNSTWSSEAAPEFVYGCMEEWAVNYNFEADIDDGSCVLDSFQDIISGNFDCLIDSRDACSGGTQSSLASTCPLISIKGILVDFGDYTSKNGPYALTLEDSNGFRLELTIWKDTWDVKSDSNYSILTVPPFYDFEVQATGNVYTYNGNRQVYVCGPEEIRITESYNLTGVHDKFEIDNVSIDPAPYVIIPALGENLNYTYTFPNNSRVLIRVFDISGRFITSLEDYYYEDSGMVYRDNIMVNNSFDPINTSAWDGRDQLGQIVLPGTYIMHLEVFNPATGETRTDAAPIVVGVKN